MIHHFFNGEHRSQLRVFFENFSTFQGSDSGKLTLKMPGYQSLSLISPPLFVQMVIPCQGAFFFSFFRKKCGDGFALVEVDDHKIHVNISAKKIIMKSQSSSESDEYLPGTSNPPKQT